MTHSAPSAAQVSANNTNKPFIPKPSSGVIGTIERLDPRLDTLLATDATMEKLAEGFDWSEGPVWDREEKCLFFSDVPQNVVYRWDEAKGLTEHLRPSGYTGAAPRGGEPGSNGLTIDPWGNLVLCQHGDRRVAVYEPLAVNPPPESRASVHSVMGLKNVADRFEGKRFNSPNDLCFDNKHHLCFTDPPYGLPKNIDDPTKELPFQGVYRVSPQREVALLTKELSRPNGLAFSPDYKTLYVANSDPDKPIIMAYPYRDDGTLGEGRIFFDAAKLAADKNNKGLPDGLKVDTQGNLWATGPGGVLIIGPDGKHLGTLRTGVNTANCAWGDDGSTLYVTADMYLVRIKTKAKGW